MKQSESGQILDVPEKVPIPFLRPPLCHGGSSTPGQEDPEIVLDVLKVPLTVFLWRDVYQGGAPESGPQLRVGGLQAKTRLSC